MSGWLGALRTYILVIGVGNLAWETAHLPLYTIWSSGSLREQVVAVLHCTGGDLLIAVSAITAALVTSATPRWPEETFERVAVIAIVIGLAYTGFSEWLNVHVRHTWTYAPLMPILPSREVWSCPPSSSAGGTVPGNLDRSSRYRSKTAHNPVSLAKIFKATWL